MGKVHVRLATFMLAFSLISFIFDKSYADPLRLLGQNLPNRVMIWTAEEEDRFFDKVTIFDYINGAGEVYLSYNMQNCLSRLYTASEGPAINMDIFDMGSSEDAYGVFSHDQDGESIDMGQDALYRPGWLSFWKDRFFVSIYADEETVEANRAVKELGRAVESLIKGTGQRPGILLRLPKEGLKPKSIRYLHDNELLNYHFYLSDENILNLGPKTNAALAEYKVEDEEAWLLLVSYPDPETGGKAIASVRKHYLTGADGKGSVKLENGRWAAASLKGKLLVFVLEADGPGITEDLIKKVK